MNREARNRALNILENGTQAQYQDEAVKEYLDAKTIAIDSIKKLNKIERILEEMDPLNTIIKIREVLEQE